MNGHLSIFRWINFYTFENLGSEFGIPILVPPPPHPYKKKKKKKKTLKI